MHSSRIRTARSSSRLLGRGVSASVHAGIHPLGLGLDTPLVLGLKPPPGVGLDMHLGVGLDPPSQTPQTSPWLWALTPPSQIPNLPLALGLATPNHPHSPSVNRILDTRFWKYYLTPTSLRAVTIYNRSSLQWVKKMKKKLLVVVCHCAHCNWTGCHTQIKIKFIVTHSPVFSTFAVFLRIKVTNHPQRD